MTTPAEILAMAERPLNFSLSTTGLRVTGGTSSPDELRAFIQKLEALEPVMRAISEGMNDD